MQVWIKVMSSVSHYRHFATHFFQIIQIDRCKRDTWRNIVSAPAEDGTPRINNLYSNCQWNKFFLWNNQIGRSPLRCQSLHVWNYAVQFGQLLQRRFASQ